jgi:hypothetical protein
MSTPDAFILVANWWSDAQRVVASAWGVDLWAMTILALATTSIAAFVAAIITPYWRFRASKSCAWRLAPMQPHAESGQWRWRCSRCGEFGYGSAKKTPVECKRA